MQVRKQFRAVWREWAAVTAVGKADSGQQPSAQRNLSSLINYQLFSSITITYLVARGHRSNLDPHES